MVIGGLRAIRTAAAAVAVAPLVIEGVDKPGERYVVDVARDHLTRGRFYDFARWGKPLRAGGVYRAVFGAQTIVFQIDAHAEPGDMPVMSRLLRFSLPS
jgi:hypothetical protein